MNELHEIELDLTPWHGGFLYWEWESLFPRGFQPLLALLAAHAELQRRYPEDEVKKEEQK